MKMNKLKEITPILLWCGLGFAASSVLGLDGFRDTVQLPQLVIGGAAMLIAVAVHLIFVYTNQ